MGDSPLGKHPVLANPIKFVSRCVGTCSAARRNSLDHGPRFQVCEKCRRGLVGWPHVPCLKISHRLFAARCVAAIIDRGRLLPRDYRPKPRLTVGCLRMSHDAADYWSTSVTEPHIVVVLVPVTRTTAFACGYKNKVGVFDLGMNHRDARHDPLCAAAYPAAQPRLN